MGIRFFCPNGHKLNVKEFQAGRRGICPFCGARIQIPTQSTRPSSKSAGRQGAAQATTQTLEQDDPESAQASDSSPDILPGEPPSLPGDPSGGKMLGPSTPVGTPSGSGPVIAPPTLPAGGRGRGGVRHAVGRGGAISARPRCDSHRRRRRPAPCNRLRPRRAPVVPATPAAAPGPRRRPSPAPTACRLPAADRARRAAGSRATRRAGTGRSDRRSTGNDLVRSAAVGRAVRPGLRRSDEDLAERRPRERRFARLARGLARLAGGRQGVSQTPQQPDHRLPGNDPRGHRRRCRRPHTPIGPRSNSLPIATRSPCWSC